MASKTPLTANELKIHLDEQLQFLELSADSFDRGFDSEAKRLATVVRVLVHDTSKSSSLLSQLGMKQQPFFDTSIPFDRENMMPHSGLIGVVAGNLGTKYVPLLDMGPIPARHVSFEEWWGAQVFVDGQKKSFSRKDIILTAANQDGGAHVDPGLDSAYATLSRDNSLNWFGGSPDKFEPLPFPERAAIRQIAHEVLKTLKPGYSKRGDFGGLGTGLVVSGLRLRAGAIFPSGPPPKLGRNELCYCGSRRKFKHCHGRLA
ncbi:MAG: SEC-C domain-containing protein [Hyphomicrobiales bacterium]|nr:SEC-C domain-containing protein [Hyphomicrobiales bacterium]